MTRAISLVISEAALEKIPVNIIDHPSVTNHARKLGKRPSEILLDRSYHHAANAEFQSRICLETW